jgi:hypothetical protein
LPGVPLHITLRGINKGAIFLDEEDRYHFKYLLRKAFRDQAIALHAFVRKRLPATSCSPPQAMRAAVGSRCRGLWWWAAEGLFAAFYFLFDLEET